MRSMNTTEMIRTLCTYAPDGDAVEQVLALMELSDVHTHAGDIAEGLGDENSEDEHDFDADMCTAMVHDMCEALGLAHLFTWWMHDMLTVHEIRERMGTHIDLLGL
jgi:hypothetical protein